MKNKIITSFLIIVVLFTVSTSEAHAIKNDELFNGDTYTRINEDNMQILNNDLNAISASGQEITESYIVDTKDKAKGEYDTGIVWDTRYKRIGLGGFLFEDDFNYPKGQVFPTKWETLGNVPGEAKVESLGPGQFYVERFPGQYMTTISGPMTTIDNFTKGEVRFEITPKSGFNRVALYPKKQPPGFEGAMFMVSFNVKTNEMTMGSNYINDRNGTLDRPRNGFTVNWDEFKRRFGVKGRITDRKNVRMVWNLNSGIDVYVNDVLTVRNMWQGIIGQHNPVHRIRVSAGNGNGIKNTEPGVLIAHYVEIRQLDALSGSYTSRPTDISFTKKSKGIKATIDWKQSNINDTKVSVKTRTRSSGGSWSNWRDVSNGGNVPDFPKLKSGNIQFKVDMKTDDAQKGPWIKNIRVRVHGDTTAPTVKFNPMSSNWTNDTASTDITATDTGGSGFKHMRTRKYSGSRWGDWSSWTTSSTKKIAMSGTGIRKVQVEVEDNAENRRTVTSGDFKVDKVAPDGKVTANITSWTNKDVILTFKGTDNDSGVKRVRKPDGVWINGSSTSYTATKNGTYTFRVEDNAGNIKDVSYKVDNIDKVSPNGVITGNPTSWTNKDVTLTFKGTDNDSGVKRIKKPDNTWVNGSSTSYTATKNGTYTFRVEDNAGNIKDVSYKVDNIDKVKPDGKVTANITSWTNKNVVLTFKGTDNESGVKRILKPDGIWVNGSSTSYTATENGTYTFRVEDNAGNIKDVSYKVDNIDKVKPDGKVTANITSWTNKNVILTFNGTDSGSGVKGIHKPDGVWVSGNSTSYTVTENGTYTFKVEDNAGNIKDISYKVDNIDKVNPDGSITADTTSWTNTNVVLTFKGTDKDSGVKRILKPDGTWINGSSTSYTTTENGTYTFRVEDNAGNIKDISYKVDNIDKTKPKGIITGNPTLWTNKDVILKFKATDNYSGIKEIQSPDNVWIKGDSINYTVYKNGTYVFKAKDNANNIEEFSVSVTKIDKDNPNISYDITSKDWTKENVLVDIKMSDTGGSNIGKYRTRIRRDGKWQAWKETNVNPASKVVNHSIKLDKEGVYEIEAEVFDLAGNKTTRSAGEYKVDKSAPTVNTKAYPVGHTEVIKNNEVLDGKFDVKMTYSDNGRSGVDKVWYYLSQDKKVKDSNFSEYKDELIRVSNNGHNYIHIKAVDNVGNELLTTKTYELRNNAPTFKLHHTSKNLHRELVSIDVYDKEKDNIELEVYVEGPELNGVRPVIPITLEDSDTDKEASEVGDSNLGYIRYTNLVDGDNIKFSFVPIYVGDYRISVRAKDKYNKDTKFKIYGATFNDDTDEDLKEVIETEFTGYVKHTEKWNENRMKFNRRYNKINNLEQNDDSPRGYNVFFPGERFILKAVPDTSKNHQAIPETMEVLVYDKDSSERLQKIILDEKGNGNNKTWEGEYWDYSMLMWKDKKLKFVFLGTYPNKEISTFERDVEVTISENNFYRLKKDKINKYK